jgi:hypothetical protein
MISDISDSRVNEKRIPPSLLIVTFARESELSDARGDSALSSRRVPREHRAGRSAAALDSRPPGDFCRSRQPLERDSLKGQDIGWSRLAPKRSTPDKRGDSQ